MYTPSNRRGETVIAGFTGHLIGYIFNRIFTEIPNQGVRYFGVVWTQIFGTFSHPLNITWLSLACTDSEERALAMAMVITGANMAGIYGAQIFREDDEPRYRRAFSVDIAIIAFGLSLVVVRYLDDVRNRVRAKTNAQIKAALAEETEKHEYATPPSEDLPAPLVADEKRLSVSQGLKATT